MHLLGHDHYDYTISALCFQQLKARAAGKVQHIQHRPGDINRGQHVIHYGVGGFSTIWHSRNFNKILGVKAGLLRVCVGSVEA